MSEQQTSAEIDATAKAIVVQALPEIARVMKRAVAHGDEPAAFLYFVGAGRHLAKFFTQLALCECPVSVAAMPLAAAVEIFGAVAKRRPDGFAARVLPQLTEPHPLTTLRVIVVTPPTYCVGTISRVRLPGAADVPHICARPS